VLYLFAFHILFLSVAIYLVCTDPTDRELAKMEEQYKQDMRNFQIKS